MCPSVEIKIQIKGGNCLWYNAEIRFHLACACVGAYIMAAVLAVFPTLGVYTALLPMAMFLALLPLRSQPLLPTSAVHQGWYKTCHMGYQISPHTQKCDWE